uniref:Uncharacterized protein n=1 Tax=Arundo donax TaxID=35708 RepID=A0A0A9E9B8_ARUDO
MPIIKGQRQSCHTGLRVIEQQRNNVN